MNDKALKLGDLFRYLWYKKIIIACATAAALVIIIVATAAMYYINGGSNTKSSTSVSGRIAVNVDNAFDTSSILLEEYSYAAFYELTDRSAQLEAYKLSFPDKVGTNDTLSSAAIQWYRSLKLTFSHPTVGIIKYEYSANTEQLEQYRGYMEAIVASAETSLSGYPDSFSLSIDTASIVTVTNSVPSSLMLLFQLKAKKIVLGTFGAFIVLLGVFACIYVFTPRVRNVCDLTTSFEAPVLAVVSVKKKDTHNRYGSLATILDYNLDKHSTLAIIARNRENALAERIAAAWQSDKCTAIVNIGGIHTEQGSQSEDNKVSIISCPASEINTAKLETLGKEFDAVILLVQNATDDGVSLNAARLAKQCILFEIQYASAISDIEDSIRGLEGIGADLTGFVLGTVDK